MYLQHVHHYDMAIVTAILSIALGVTIPDDVAVIGGMDSTGITQLPSLEDEWSAAHIYGGIGF